MGEARRRKLAGEYPDPTRPRLSREDAIRAAFDLLREGTDPSVCGATVILPSGEQVYLSAGDAKAETDGSRH